MSLSLVARVRCAYAELSRTVSFSDFSTREMQLKADIGRGPPRVRLNYDGGVENVCGQPDRGASTLYTRCRRLNNSQGSGEDDF